LGAIKIASVHNPEKFDLVEVEFENIDGRREKANFLPDTGVNITAFQPEILPQLGMSVDNLRMVATVPKSADGSNLKTLGAVDVRLSKSGHTTKFITAFVIKNLQQPILSRQLLRELGMIPKDFPFAQLSIGNGAEFQDESIEKLEAALRQARANRGERVSAATFPKIKLGKDQTSTRSPTNFRRFSTTRRSLRWPEVTTSSIWRMEQSPSTKDHREPCPNLAWKN
jgi:hypothetical protein